MAQVAVTGDGRGSRRSCFWWNLNNLADGYGIGVADLWDHPVSRAMDGEPAEALVRRLLGPGRDAVEYVAWWPLR
jgi:hypothetical protein